MLYLGYGDKVMSKTSIMQQLAFTEYWLNAKYDPRHFANTDLFNPNNNPVIIPNSQMKNHTHKWG